jgi:dCMP deaminase
MEPDSRICWDEYFMSIATLAACRSPCQRLHVGSVIVKDNRLISMGYNGYLSGCKHISHIRDGHEQATIHSEMNALTDCAKRGVQTADSKIYITHYPCLNCFKALCASGVTEIIYLNNYNNDPLVKKIGEEANIRIRQLYTESASASVSESVPASESDS